MKKIWILTREHNQYDQEGEYFVAAFASKPTHGRLAKVLSGDGYANLADVMAAVAYLEHVLEGGGREEDEDVWYNLREEPLF